MVLLFEWNSLKWALTICVQPTVPSFTTSYCEQPLSFFFQIAVFSWFGNLQGLWMNNFHSTEISTRWSILGQIQCCYSLCYWLSCFQQDEVTYPEPFSACERQRACVVLCCAKDSPSFPAWRCDIINVSINDFSNELGTILTSHSQLLA